MTTTYRPNTTHIFPTICLCGSTQYIELFDLVSLELTRLGCLVFSLGSHRHTDEQLRDQRRWSKTDATLMERVHREKILRADLVLVISGPPDYHVGTHTEEEEACARARGIQVQRIPRVFWPWTDASPEACSELHAYLDKAVQLTKEELASRVLVIDDPLPWGPITDLHQLDQGVYWIQTNEGRGPGGILVHESMATRHLSQAALAHATLLESLRGSWERPRWYFFDDGAPTFPVIFYEQRLWVMHHNPALTALLKEQRQDYRDALAASVPSYLKAYRLERLQVTR